MSELKELIDKLVKNHIESRKEEREVGKYYVSEIPYCGRRLYYLYKIGSRHNFKKLLFFEACIGVHERFSKILGSNVVSKLEEPVILDLNEIKIIGKCDMVILSNNGVEYVIEFKTVSGLSNIVDIPDKQHIEQLNMYMGILGIGKGALVYIDRNNYNYLVFEHEFSYDMYRRLLEKVLKLHNNIISNIPPEREVNWWCGFCEFKFECFTKK